MIPLKAFLVLIAAVAFALSPWFVTGFNGFSADQFPIPQDDPPIQPAGYAFAIWGLIYAWLIVSAGFGVLNRRDHADWDAARWPLILSLGLGAGWIPLAIASPVWATGLIWLMWATAVVALIKCPTRDRWWFAVPTGLYAGWLSAASPVGTAIVLTGYGATPVIMIHAAVLILGLGLAWVVLRLRPEPAYTAAVIWALVGIILSNLSPAQPVMIALPLIGIALVALIGLRGYRRSL